MQPSSRPHRSIALGGALTVLLLTLGACATWLDPPLGQKPEGPCDLSDERCFALGKEAFETYRRERIARIEETSAGYRLPSAPLGLFHGRRTSYSALLIHGLNDSPYYMAEIAAALHEEGFNAVTVLLPGHGTRSEDMADVTAEQWRAEVGKGLRIASRVGRRVTLVGFSLGAALAIDTMLSGAQIDGLFLFAPAIQFRSEFVQTFAGLTCIPGVKSIAVQTDIVENPVKYKRRTANGVCQTHRVIQNNFAQGSGDYEHSVPQISKIRRMGARVTVPTFVVLTYEDARVSPGGIIAFAANVRAPVRVATFGPKDTRRTGDFESSGSVVHLSDDPLAHSFMLRRSNPYNGQADPNFDKVRALMIEHLRTHFPAAADDAP